MRYKIIEYMKLEANYMFGNKMKGITAVILGKVALGSVKAAADSRCMYCLHQPKQPTGIKKFCK
jgi:cyclic lactone autoinducer peptide